MMASITPLGERGRSNRWWWTASALTVGSVAGGWALGLASGVLGRAAAAAALSGGTLADGPAAALAAATLGAAGAVELGGWRLPTLRRQVDEEWLPRYRGWVYGFGFGVQLGVGLVTTVTTAAVYALVALAALAGATGEVAVAQTACAVFGLVRALPVLAGARMHDPDQLRRRLRRVTGAAWASRMAAGSSLCLLGMGAAALPGA